MRRFGDSKGSQENLGGLRGLRVPPHPKPQPQCVLLIQAWVCGFEKPEALPSRLLLLQAPSRSHHPALNRKARNIEQR